MAEHDESAGPTPEEQAELEDQAQLDAEDAQPSGDETLTGEVVPDETEGEGEDPPAAEQPPSETVTEEAREPDEAKPSPTDLVIPSGLSPDETRTAVVHAFDRADEEQILDELQNRMLEIYVYDFSDGGRRYVDLSYAGVREAARTANRDGAGISCPDAPVVNEINEDGEDFYRVIIRAVDNMGGSQWGTAVEPKLMSYTVKKGADKGEKRKKWDKFALTKAINKAQRNAMRALLPAPLVEAMKAKYLGDEQRVRKLQRGVMGPAGTVAQLPAPLTDDKAVELRRQIEAVYDELCEISTAALLPALYQEYLQRSAHSHEELERMLAWLKKLTAETKAEAEKPAHEVKS